MSNFNLIQVKDNQVSAEGLHEFLEINTRFNDWITRIIEKYDFVEGEDFYSKMSKTSGRPKTEYYFTVDTAKEVAMVSNTERGKQARKYFIAKEKEAKALVPQQQLSRKEMAKYWLEAEEEKERLQKENTALASNNALLASQDLEVKTQKEYKWKQQVIQNNRGRTINYYVNKYFFNGSYSKAHRNAKQSYYESTGIRLPDIASAMSMEQKKDYLDWLSKFEPTL